MGNGGHKKKLDDRDLLPPKDILFVSNALKHYIVPELLKIVLEYYIHLWRDIVYCFDCKEYALKTMRKWRNVNYSIFPRIMSHQFTFEYCVITHIKNGQLRFTLDKNNRFICESNLYPVPIDMYITRLSIWVYFKRIYNKHGFQLPYDCLLQVTIDEDKLKFDEQTIDFTINRIICSESRNQLVIYSGRKISPCQYVDLQYLVWDHEKSECLFRIY